MPEVVRFGVSMEEELLRAFDAWAKKKGYSNRSEALRDLVREALLPQAWTEGEEALGVILLFYHHHKRELLSRLTEAQHRAQPYVLSSLHIHVDEERCLEILAVRGPAQELEKLADQMRAQPGVLLGCLCPAGTTGPL